jgi:hypothetical protein
VDVPHPLRKKIVIVAKIIILLTRLFIASPSVFFTLQGSAQRFALPALGRAAGRRPTGKMLRRRKRLGIAPESPASGARFVGRRVYNGLCNFKRSLASFVAYAVPTLSLSRLISQVQ